MMAKTSHCLLDIYCSLTFLIYSLFLFLLHSSVSLFHLKSHQHLSVGLIINFTLYQYWWFPARAEKALLKHMKSYHEISFFFHFWGCRSHLCWRNFSYLSPTPKPDRKPLIPAQLLGCRFSLWRRYCPIRRRLNLMFRVSTHLMYFWRSVRSRCTEALNICVNIGIILFHYVDSANS